MAGAKDLAEAAVLRLKPVKVEMADKGEEDGDDADTAWESVAGDLIDAIKSGDKATVVDSLKAAMAMCMSEDHSDDDY